ncbi:MAG: hypothetical protein U0R52_11370 [Solirubrobacterales bacterium]
MSGREVDEQLEGEVVAEEDAEGVAAEARPLPLPYRSAGSPVLRSEVRTAALAAAGGALAGAATVAAVRAVGAVGSRRRLRRAPRRQERVANVVASRSFLIDVHLLGR